MARWIDADALKDWSEIVPLTGDGGIDINDFDEKLASMPAADVAPVRHGHWVKAERRGCVSYADAYAKCDHCHKVIFDAWNFDYCPRCGARMDGGDGE